MIRFAMALAMLAAAPAAAFQLAVAPPTASQLVQVQLMTGQGPIMVEVDRGRAPITAANFLRYVDEKRFDGTSFYRAVKVGEGYGLLQGGTRNDPKRTMKPIAHEPTTSTGLSHKDGAIAMARAEPGTASGDFFIVVGDLTSMDADPTAAGDNQGYAVFGRIVGGMELVRQLLLAPTSPTEGEGAMKGQMLSPVIPIVSVRRAN